MKRVQLDMRQRSCPEPVTEALRALNDPSIEVVEVLLDNDAAAENIARSGRSRGCSVSVESGPGQESRVCLTRKTTAFRSGPPTPIRAEHRGAGGSDTNLVVLLASDCFGEGDEAIGRALLVAYVTALPEVTPLPGTVILLNSGVALGCRGSECLEPLRCLENSGTAILVCLSIRDSRSRENDLDVGRIADMGEIAAILARADKVIRP